ncbi:phosphate/phosphite/phosphonate ABC transporter substrate-binding protein [Pseudoduganella violaceinigra]|uniref:phosphate/phosphite/phosphonate ABC transporter substrate-binding protein n=1 Tax=Pseudoduganella violaceinigra TaxID=246602 RepID=UPI0003FCD1E8|nr:phosphate/phosphite/phosphonate ABC transporter substrate-binding protein [Pseudoduganella violaceinigra]
MVQRRTILGVMLAAAALFRGHASGQDKALRLAANPNLSAIELLNNFGPFARELEKELGRPVRLVSGRDYDDTLRLLKDGQVDIAGTGAFGYVTAHDDFGARLVVRYLEDDGDSYHAIIFTRQDSGLRSVADLRGKRFAFTDVKSTSGYLMPLLELHRNGIGLADLGKVDHVKKQPNAAIAVYNRQADAGAMADNQLNEKYGVKIDELRILWRSPPIPHGVWIARADMDEGELARISQAILRISRSEEGRKALAQASVRGFAAVSDADFSFVRSAARQLQKLQAESRP